MNKPIGILCVLAFIINSCDLGCDGCDDRNVLLGYYMTNLRNEPVTLAWFSSPKDSSIITYASPIPENEYPISAREFSILEGEKIVLCKWDWRGVSGEINRPFGGRKKYAYDSVRISSTSDTVTYTENNCELSGNPLCEENYELIKSIDTKTSYVKEWEFKIE